MSPPAAISLWFVAALLGMMAATGTWLSLLFTLPAAARELLIGWAILLAGSAIGLPIVRLLPEKRADPLLQAVTAALIGLAILSSLVLVLGTAGLLAAWFWISLVAACLVGLLAWTWRQRDTLKLYRQRLECPIAAASLLAGVACAFAAGIWLAGAMRPPGLIGMPGDGYDVTLYHLQVPREYLQAGRIHALEHNVYSFYPMHVEMLYLLGMVLRGGAYEGVYLAKILHGLHAVLAVAGLYAIMRRRHRTLAAPVAALLATAPFLPRLGWVAMVELGEFAYLVLALAWLRLWLARPSWASAAMVGLALGASCCVKYLSVGFIVAPVMAVMLLTAAMGRRRLVRLPQVAMVAGLTLALFAPWLIRNAALTGNPVFPLATDIFGRGHWTLEAQQRWIQGHRPGNHAPVPEPIIRPSRAAPPSRLSQAIAGLAGPLLNPLLVAAGLVSALWATIAWLRRRRPWPASLAVILAIQLAIWILATHELPPRFLSPALVVLCLLTGEALGALSRTFRPLPALAIILLIAVMGLALSVRTYRLARGPVGYIEPIDPAQVARRTLEDIYRLPPDSRVLLIGEARAFYYPPGTLYATPFDAQVLLDVLAGEASPAEQLRRMRQAGVTHILVNWREIRRLALTYGYPEPLSTDALLTAAPGQEPRLGILHRLEPLGLVKVGQKNAPGPRPEPMTTLYALPRPRHDQSPQPPFQAE
jgi:hypothetical protein